MAPRPKAATADEARGRVWGHLTRDNVGFQVRSLGIRPRVVLL